MNRWTWLLGTALATFGALSPSEAAAQGKANVYSSYRATPRDGQLRAVMGEGSTFLWANADDFPGLADRRLTKTLRMRVDLDAADTITGCTVIEPTGHKAIDDAACPLIRKRAAFRHALAADGKPEDGEVEVGINFYFYDETHVSPAPPAPPPPPPGPPPRPGSPPPARIEVAPNWASYAPVGWSGDAQVAVDLVVGGKGASLCRVGQSSGNEALDTMTCAAAEAATYSGYGRIGLLVDWKGTKVTYKASIRPYPMRPYYDPRKAMITGVPASAVMRKGGMAEVMVTPKGGISACRVVASAGSDLADVRACETFRKLKFLPGEDMFGRRVEMKQIVPMNFAPKP